MERKALSISTNKNNYVYNQKNCIYRVIKEDKDFYLSIVENKELMTTLNKSGVIESYLFENTAGVELILTHRKIDFVSFPIEWSFDMLKDAALKTIEVAIELDRNGLMLHDAHPYNILFDYSKPVFIDFCSIVENKEVIRLGWKRGFFVEFLIPLILLSNNFKKINNTYFYWENYPKRKLKYSGFLMKFNRGYHSIFTKCQSKKELYLELYDYIKAISLKKYKTTWEDYYNRDANKDFTEDTTWTEKETSAMTFLRRVKAEGLNTMLDIASNEGWFSLAAESIGFKVVACDYDERAINNLYLKIRHQRKQILPLVLDLINPTRSHGINQIWDHAYNRLACDVTLCMAIIHHLSLKQNVRFEVFADIIHKLSKKYCIIEFIGRDDIHIQKWLIGKDWYNEEKFIKAMEKHFEYVDCLPSNLKTRKIFLFNNKN